MEESSDSTRSICRMRFYAPALRVTIVAILRLVSQIAAKTLFEYYLHYRKIT